MQDFEQQETNMFSEHAKNIRLHINKGKTKALRLNEKKTAEIKLENDPIADVVRFTYLGVMAGKKDGTDEVKMRIAIAQNYFRRLNKLWKASETKLRT